MKRGALNISFAWLFAIIVGAFVLFLAIYISIKVIGLGETQTNLASSEQFGVLLNPLETGFESGKNNTISFPSEARIYNRCSEAGNFGEQTIGISQKSFNKWSEEQDYIFYNKYIFSEGTVEGKKFDVFSIPFDYPFKIGDLIFITGEEYCFVDAPKSIEDEITLFGNVKTENCSSQSIKVCFNRNCDISVNYIQGFVDKNNTRLYFTGNLMYAAIFSDKQTYECQTKRLMKRTDLLSSLYIDKINFMKNQCPPELDSDLFSLKNSAMAYETSEDLILIDSIAESIRQKNKISECPIF